MYINKMKIFYSKEAFSYVSKGKKKSLSEICIEITHKKE